LRARGGKEGEGCETPCKEKEDEARDSLTTFSMPSRGALMAVYKTKRGARHYGRSGPSSSPGPRGSSLAPPPYPYPYPYPPDPLSPVSSPTLKLPRGSHSRTHPGRSSSPLARRPGRIRPSDTRRMCLARRCCGRVRYCRTLISPLCSCSLGLLSPLPPSRDRSRVPSRVPSMWECLRLKR
jgi:hypothetical protein